MSHKWLSSDQLKAETAVEDALVLKAGIADALPGDGDSRRVRFVVSTGDVDRDNDVINQNGWDLENYRRNPVVLFAHSHCDLPIGKCVELGIADGKLVAVAEFATHEFADTVYQLVKGGFLNATSVGFRARKYAINEERRGIDFEEQELLEFSVVPVPANQHALIAAAATGISLEPVKAWAKSILGAAETATAAVGALKAVVPGAPTEAEAIVEPGAVRPAVEAAAEAETEKRGRTLSAKNENRLKEAMDLVVGAMARIKEVLDAAAPPASSEPAEDEDDDQDEDEELSASAADVIVLEIEDRDEVLELADAGDDEIALSAEDVKTLLRDVVASQVAEAAREAAQTALNQMRGRVD